MKHLDTQSLYNNLNHAASFVKKLRDREVQINKQRRALDNEMEKIGAALAKINDRVRLPSSLPSVGTAVSAKIKNGLERAKAEGKQIGRIGLPEERKQQILAFRKTNSIAKTAKAFKVSRTTVTRLGREAKNGTAPTSVKAPAATTSTRGRRKHLSKAEKQQIVAFRKTHTIEETLKQFNVGHSTVSRVVAQSKNGKKAE